MKNEWHNYTVSTGVYGLPSIEVRDGKDQSLIAIIPWNEKFQPPEVESAIASYHAMLISNAPDLLELLTLISVRLQSNDGTTTEASSLALELCKILLTEKNKFFYRNDKFEAGDIVTISEMAFAEKYILNPNWCWGATGLIPPIKVTKVRDISSDDYTLMGHTQSLSVIDSKGNFRVLCGYYFDPIDREEIPKVNMYDMLSRADQSALRMRYGDGFTGATLHKKFKDNCTRYSVVSFHKNNIPDWDDKNMVVIQAISATEWHIHQTE